MPKTLERWTVLPHGRLTRIEDNILTVVGDIRMPLTHFPRRMTVVRLADRRLVVYSAIALDAGEMQALQQFGLPAYLIVPGDSHRMDAKIWKDRFPNMLVIAPEGARPKVEEVVHVDSTKVDFRDPHVRFVSVPGTNGHEAALVVENPTGTTLIVNHVIGNLDDRSGFSGFVLRAMGFTGPEPRIPRVAERSLIKDPGALRTQLESWARIRGLKRIIVSHGAPIERDPSGALRKLATSLAA
jgi:hypothetical protein